MHDINWIYSQYMVNKAHEERQEQAASWRRAEDVAARVPLVARVIALLRWQRTSTAVEAPPMTVAPTTEGAGS